MFQVGEFSKIARVSGRLLRYYDEIGLFPPSLVDDETGYRYYSAAQLPRLNRILALKELGLSLDQIGKMMDRSISSEEIRGMLLMRRAEAEEALVRESDRLRQIESRLEQIDRIGDLGDWDVVLKPIPGRRIITIRETCNGPEDGLRMAFELHRALPGKVRPGALGSFMAVTHSDDFELEDIDVEMGFFLNGAPPTEELTVLGHPVAVRELPAHDPVACVVRNGKPEDAHTVTGPLGHFMEQRGYRMAGPTTEIFLKMPRPDRPEDAVVEMQYPVVREALKPPPA